MELTFLFFRIKCSPRHCPSNWHFLLIKIICSLNLMTLELILPAIYFSSSAYIYIYSYIHIFNRAAKLTDKFTGTLSWPDTENLILIKLNQIVIVIRLFRLIWHQTAYHLAENRSEKCNYNLKLLISKRYLKRYLCA